MTDKPSDPAEGTQPDEAQSHSDAPPPDAAPKEKTSKNEGKTENHTSRAQSCRTYHPNSPKRLIKKIKVPKKLTSPKLTSPNLPGVFLAPYGNAAGDKIESTLGTVGRPVGKGLETITRPVGGVVDGLVGGLMRSGGAYGDVAGVGAGNMDHKRAKENEEAHEPVGGEEQTAENPLGLHGDKE